MNGPGDSMLGDTLADDDEGARAAALERLRHADLCFDRDAAGRREALEIYAELADSIDPSTSEGAARLSRTLSDPRPPDRRLAGLFGRASLLASDPVLRDRCHYAAARFALADWQFARCEAVLDRADAEGRRRGDPSPQVFNLRIGLRISQAREHEALELAERFEQLLLPLGDLVGLALAARHRASALHLAGAHAQSLDALTLCEVRCDALAPIAAVALRLRCRIERARALRNLGELDAAGAALEGADDAAAEDSEEAQLRVRVACERAALHLARRDPDAAIAEVRTVEIRDVAGPMLRTECWTIAAEAAAQAGNGRAANAAALRILDLTSNDPQRTSAALALARAARLADTLEGVGATEEVARRLDRMLAESAAERFAELAASAEAVEAMRSPVRTVLGAFRARFVRERPAVAARLGIAPREPFVARAFGAHGIPGEFCCPRCLSVWQAGSPPVPAGHLLPESVRASLAESVCPACS